MKASGKERKREELTFSTTRLSPVKLTNWPRVQVGLFEHSCKLGDQAAIEEWVGVMVLVPFTGPISEGIRRVELSYDYCYDKWQ